MAVIDARGVSKRFFLRHNASYELKVRFLGMFHPQGRQSVEEFWALRNISLRIERGEAVALVGRNGSGKSTFLKLIAAIHRPTTGRMLVARNAQISSMIELGVGFHPELTGRENVFLNAAIHGLSRPAIEELYGDIVEYSGLDHFIDVPIKNYSSGMYMRLGFAIAANLDPDILLLDEIFAVGDAEFQQKCLGTIRRFMDAGKTIIFVSHAPAAIRAMCRRVCVLDQSQLAFDGDLESGLAFYERLSVRPADVTQTIIEQAPIEPVAEMSAAPLAGRGELQLNDRGVRQFQFLREQGLLPEHRLLDIGGTSRADGHLVPFLKDHHYTHVEFDELIKSAGNGDFDVAIASSLFSMLPFNSVARCIATVLPRLSATGQFYATWYENTNPADFSPIVHACGVTTYPDREPYHYPYGLIAEVCGSLGATVERLDSPLSETGESVLRITRRSAV
jgi:ABC-type polysaccharide/polyol phosphate transport system ATPase subunit